MILRYLFLNQEYEPPFQENIRPKVRLLRRRDLRGDQRLNKRNQGEQPEESLRRDQDLWPLSSSQARKEKTKIHQHEIRQTHLQRRRPQQKGLLWRRRRRNSWKTSQNWQLRQRFQLRRNPLDQQPRRPHPTPHPYSQQNRGSAQFKTIRIVGQGMFRSLPDWL